jgi:CDP-diacylglycerol pyrophosphatase
MKVKSEKKEKSQALGYILSLAAMAAMVALFAAAVLNFSGRTGAREEETLRKAVARASVQCYAIEGRYPPSVEYLEENYGVRIDRDRYNVFYNGFASNVMPEIVINPIEEEEARR